MQIRPFAVTAAAATLVALAGTAVGGPAGADQPDASGSGSGPDFVYDATSPLAGADVSLAFEAIGEGGTQVRLDVAGVDAPAGTHFGAHVHVNACGATGGAAGGHYVQPDALGSLRHREVWLDFHIDADGEGHAVATRDFRIPDLASRSVIVHALGTDHATGVAGGRILCTDIDA